MAEEKSHDNMDLSNKKLSLEIEEEGLNLDNSYLWEVLQFSPPSPIEITLRCCALAEDTFFSELFIQLTDKLTAAKELTYKEHTKKRISSQVINKCLTHFDIMEVTLTRNKDYFKLDIPKQDLAPTKTLEPNQQRKKNTPRANHMATVGNTALNIAAQMLLKRLGKIIRHILTEERNLFYTCKVFHVIIT